LRVAPSIEEPGAQAPGFRPVGPGPAKRCRVQIRDHLSAAYGLGRDAVLLKPLVLILQLEVQTGRQTRFRMSWKNRLSASPWQLALASWLTLYPSDRGRWGRPWSSTGSCLFSPNPVPRHRPVHCGLRPLVQRAPAANIGCPVPAALVYHDNPAPANSPLTFPRGDRNLVGYPL
jgi:hypothetical protein